MAVNFGVSQITNPTPSRINLWVRVFTVAGAIFLAWMSTSSIIGPHSKDAINQILGLFLGLTNGLAPLFGVEINPSAKVKASDVTAMEDNSETKK